MSQIYLGDLNIYDLDGYYVIYKDKNHYLENQDVGLYEFCLIGHLLKKPIYAFNEQTSKRIEKKGTKLILLNRTHITKALKRYTKQYNSSLLPQLDNIKNKVTLILYYIDRGYLSLPKRHIFNRANEIIKSVSEPLKYVRLLKTFGLMDDVKSITEDSNKFDGMMALELEKFPLIGGFDVGLNGSEGGVYEGESGRHMLRYFNMVDKAYKIDPDKVPDRSE